MSQKLIIIRGNSGSGKSTIAHMLRDTLDGRIMLLPQDILRRDILKADDKVGNPMIGLLDQLISYGYEQGYTVIVEGILLSEKYKPVLVKAVSMFDEAYVYYLDVPFGLTLERHQNRLKHEHFGEAEMREWWVDQDYLNIPNEVVIKNNGLPKTAYEKIMNDLRNTNGDI